MLTAKGAPPMILTIILVHSISYIKPVTPEPKKQTKTRVTILLAELCGTVFFTMKANIVTFGRQCQENQLKIKDKTTLQSCISGHLQKHIFGALF